MPGGSRSRGSWPDRKLSTQPLGTSGCERNGRNPSPQDDASETLEQVCLRLAAQNAKTTPTAPGRLLQVGAPQLHALAQNQKRVLEDSIWKSTRVRTPPLIPAQ